MKAFLTASALIVALAAPAAAQTSDVNTSGSFRHGDIMADQGVPASDTVDGVDTSTTQSIKPVIDNLNGVGRDDSSPMREDASDNGSRAVGGRAN